MGYSTKRAKATEGALQRLLHAHGQSLTDEPGFTVSPAGVRTSRKEMLQFDFFCRVASADMAGVFDQKLCSRDMLQATSYHPTVWHASCALAAMYRREALAVQATGKAAEVVLEMNELRNFALEQYNASSTGVRALMSKDEVSVVELQVVLTTAVIFTGIASLQGDMPAAVVHVTNGQRILQLWKKKTRNGRSVGRDDQLADGLLTAGNVEAVIGHMAIQASPIRPLPFSEDYYIGLETPVVSDDPFLSSEDAYYAFEPLSRSFSELRENNKFLKDPAMMGPRLEVRLAYQEALAKWTTKFEALKQRDGMMDGGRNEEGLVILEARQIGMEIETRRDPSSHPITWDEFEPRFAAIVALGERLKNELRPTAGRTFSYSSSMFDMYYFVCLYCRNYELRRRALDLLGSHNAREGLCNSRLAFAIATGWARVEEAPGETKLKRDADRPSGDDAADDDKGEEECGCIAKVFICNEHRVQSVEGEIRADDVGDITYFTNGGIERGEEGVTLQLAW